MNGFVCGAYVVGSSGRRKASYTCGSRGSRHDVRSGNEELSSHVRLVLVPDGNKEMRRDRCVCYYLSRVQCEHLGIWWAAHE